MRWHRLALLGTGCFSHFALAGAAYAQAADTPKPDESAATDSSGLQEIIVTAQRREQRLQDIPITVSVLSGEAIEQAGIRNSDEISQVASGLVFFQGSNSATPLIRGVGTFNYGGGDENATAIYVDGVYVSSPTSSIFSLNNLSRIEVLKGPQGTLFGRNATGGVIQVVTKDPQQTPTMDINFGYGNFDTVETSAYVSGGIGSNLAADLAVYYRDQGEGWGTNLATGSEANWRDDFAVRSKWLLDLGATRITLAGDYATIRRSPTIARQPPGYFGADGFTTYSGFYDINAGYEPGPGKAKQRGVSLKIDHDLGWARVVNIAAWRRDNDVTHPDVDAGPLPIIQIDGRNSRRTITEELQLLSPASSDISWVVGAFYLNGNSKTEPSRFSGTSLPFAYLEYNTKQDTKSYAAFAQATAPVLPRTNLTLGIRYTSDKRRLEGTQTIGVAAGPVVVPVVSAPPALKASFDKITYKIALDHHFATDIMGYVQYSTGFKSGIFNSTALTLPAVKPSTVEAYEAGLKTEFFSRRVRMNISGFYYKTKDIQINQATLLGTQVLVNAARSRNRGFDVDIDAIVVPGLTLKGAATYLDAKFTEFDSAPRGSPFPPTFTLPPISAKGYPLPFSPKWTVNLGAVYSIETAVGKFSATANYAYNSGYTGSEPIAFPGNKVFAYEVVNASLNWTDRDGGLSARLWVNNLFDEQYLINALTSPPSGATAYPAAPRTYGVALGFHF